MSIARKILRELVKSRFALGYIVILLCELKIINYLSDLPPATSNWLSKSQEILSFRIPTDNFYGPGAAILMTPFSANQNTAILAIFFYFALGSFGYWKITALVSASKARSLARLALPLNIYLIWLVNSSQDTVFEFCLLMWSCYFLVTKRFKWFVVLTYLLCQTRAGYWVFFLGTSFVLFLIEYLKNHKREYRKLIAVPLLVLSSVFNFVVYSSPSPALEGGMTAYFSYTKYHYLSLPKFDMDVFLSGPEGAFSSMNGPNVPKNSTLAEANSIYQRAAIDYALENRKETILGWMQKFDAYIFDIQKVPHLPGSYVLNQDNKTISIQNERLSWSLVVGNLFFMIYRTILLCAAFIAIGLFLASILFRIEEVKKKLKFGLLATPFLFGIVPGMLFYTETRFKIVSELCLVPLIVEMFVLSFKAGRKSRN